MKGNRVSRNTKKKLRAIMLCYTGNKYCRKEKYSKKQWAITAWSFAVWLRCVSMEDRKNANTVT